MVAHVVCDDSSDRSVRVFRGVQVPRDFILAEWKFEDSMLGSDYQWGCGYPSDYHTQRWMRDNLDSIFGWPDVVRFSWGPALEVLHKDPRRYGVCAVRWPEEDEVTEQPQRRQMDAFVGSITAKRRKIDRHHMIEECLLQQVEYW